MKIYEGTDGLRGLITKLIEVWDFKKIVYEGDGATLSTNDVVFNLWVTDEVFLRGQFSDTGTNGWIDLRTEDLTCPCVELIATSLQKGVGSYTNRTAWQP